MRLRLFWWKCSQAHQGRGPSESDHGSTFIGARQREPPISLAGSKRAISGQTRRWIGQGRGRSSAGALRTKRSGASRKRVVSKDLAAQTAGSADDRGGK